MLRRTLFITACAALVALGADKPDFTGSWKINLAKSELGRMPAPERLERSIEHKDPALKMTTLQSRDGAERTASYAYTINGQEQTVKTDHGEMKLTPRWKDNALEVITKREFQGNEMKTVEIWTLAEGGKALHVQFQMSGPRGEMTMKFVFDKQ